MDPNELKFLAEVRQRCYNDAQMTERIIHSAIIGMVERTNALKLFASDMETIAAIAMNTRLFKGNERFLADKLESVANMCALKWDDQIEKLRSKK